MGLQFVMAGMNCARPGELAYKAKQRFSVGQLAELAPFKTVQDRSRRVPGCIFPDTIQKESGPAEVGSAFRHPGRRDAYDFLFFPLFGSMFR